MQSKESFRCECLVIGSGAGGSLTADYLAKKGKEVMVVEEGPWVTLQGDQCRVVRAFPAIWRDGGAIPILGNAKFLLAEGRCVGGSTMINAGLIGSLPEEVLEEWRREYAIDGFDYPSFLRYEDEVKKKLGASIMDDRDNHAGTLLKLGASRVGFMGYDIPVAATYDENGLLKKNNMQETFLRRAISHGTKVIASCKIKKLLFRGNAVYGAEAAWSDAEGIVHHETIYCNTVLVCAGAVQSALLLRRSGITKNVGNSIRFHPYLRVVAEFDEEVNAHERYMSSFQIKEFAPEISMGVSISMPDFIASNLALHFEENRDSMRRFRNMAIYYIGIRAHANGTVRNLPFLGGSYVVRYSLNHEDLKAISFGYAKLSKVLFAAGAKKIYPAIRGVPHIARESDAARYEKEDLVPGDLNLISLHAFSSCPMGERKDMTAVDSFGKLHGFKNVYVNDASILPNAPGVNPQGPLMAMALRNLEKNFL